MYRAIRAAAIVGLILATTGEVARAQYGWYPYGGPYGWSSPYGWGYGFAGSTVQGDIERGIGVRLWGEGEYLRNAAIAESIHMQTLMNWNEYRWRSQQVLNQNYWARQKRDQDHRRALQKKEEYRLKHYPTHRDIYSGLAMNRVLDELSNPKIDPDRLDNAATAVDPTVIRQVAMFHRETRLTFDFHGLGRSPLPTRLRLEVAGKSPVRFLMFQHELEEADEVSLAELVRFLRAFQLRFGEARTSDQRAAYDILYPKLVAMSVAITPPAPPTDREDLAMRGIEEK